MGYKDEFKSEYFNVKIGETRRVKIVGEYTKVEKDKTDNKGKYTVYDFPILCNEEALKLRLFKRDSMQIWKDAGMPESLKGAVFDVTGIARIDKNGVATGFTDFTFKFVNFNK